MYGQLMAGGMQFVHCRELHLSSYRSVHYWRFYCIHLLSSENTAIPFWRS